MSQPSALPILSKEQPPIRSGYIALVEIGEKTAKRVKKGPNKPYLAHLIDKSD
ncbi:MAG: hypothetical protein OIF58_02250 [Cohaesibacter sp.]|nr:hypothetical protein [Cohaesibacter sp.]